MNRGMMQTLLNNFNPNRNEPAGFLMLGTNNVCQLEDAGLVRTATRKEMLEYGRAGNYTHPGSYHFVLTEAGKEMYRVLTTADKVAKVVDELGWLKSTRPVKIYGSRRPRHTRRARHARR